MVEGSSPSGPTTSESETVRPHPGNGGIGVRTGFAFQRIHEWLRSPANADWYRAAKRAKATMCAEESVSILNAATRDTIPIDRERARSLQWMSEKLDPEEWGPKGTQVGVKIDIGAAFIQAMRENPS